MDGGEGETMRGEPLFYAGPRFALWALLTVAFLIDWIVHFSVQIRKKPLFLVIWFALVIQLIKEGFSLSLDVLIAHDGTLPRRAGLWYTVLDSVSEVAELAVIMLVSTGWGVIYTALTNRHRIIVTGGVISLLILQLMLALNRSRTSSFAIWGLLWLAVAFSIWFYIITMISQNSKFLSASLQSRSIQMGELRPEDGEEGGAREEAIGQIDVNSPTYLKSLLYKRFTYLIVIYILVQFGAEVVVAITVVLVHGVNPAVYWLATIPRDIVEIGLFFSLCYLFRLRKDNPYFALPTEEDPDQEDPSPNFAEYADQANLVSSPPQPHPSPFPHQERRKKGEEEEDDGSQEVDLSGV